MIKKIIVIFLISLFSLPVLADVVQTPQNTLMYSETPANPVDYSSCIRNYSMPSAELFQRTLSAISSSNYKIIEIQSTSSRVLFSIFGREFWAGVTNQSSATSTLRIMPADNSFYFRKDLIERVFSEIEISKAQKIKKVY